jgi:hypothetical protein
MRASGGQPDTTGEESGTFVAPMQFSLLAAPLLPRQATGVISWAKTAATDSSSRHDACRSLLGCMVIVGGPSPAQDSKTISDKASAGLVIQQQEQ